jgi:tRNA uridine 5-carbamoylmethylation protein Kti12
MSFYVIIRGPLGCGKSTISEELIKILNAEYYAVDKVLEEYKLENDREQGYISQKSFKAVNEVIAPKAKYNLNNKKPIVFDGNFYWKSQIEDLISRLDFPHYVFTLKAPLDLCIERDRDRATPHGKDAALVVYNKTTEFDYGILIDVTKPLQECLDEILSYLPKD